jgi:outer membrane protein assembly factor BamB
MKFSRTSILLCASLLLVGCSSLNQLKFWSDPPKKLPPLPPLESKMEMHSRWNQKVGSGSRGQYLALTPVIENDVLYATDAKGYAEAIDIKTNKTKWKNKLKQPVTGGIAVGQEIVLLGTRKGEVIALSQETGAEVWRSNVDGEILSNPAITSESVVIQTSNNHVFGLDPKTGNTLWTFESSAPALTLRSTAHPVVSDDIGIVGQPNGKLVAFDVKTGDRKWEQTLMIGRGRSELQRMVDINGDLAVSNGILYATSYQGRVGAFDISSGRPYWQREMSSTTGIALVNDNSLAIADTDGVVWLLDADTGATLWKQDGLKERLLTRPTVVGDKLIVSDHKGLVHALNIDDGKLVAREQQSKKPIYAPAINNEENNEFFIFDSAGKLKAYQLS